MLNLMQDRETKAVFDLETLRADTSNPEDKTKTAAATAPMLQGEAPINILIVDDEPRNLTVLEAILDNPGYRLVRAETAEQALLALLADEFALLILDIRMPGVTGFELAQMIKARKKSANVPIIFLTAYYYEDQHIIEGYQAGAADYVNKPLNPAILRSKVAIFAELHRKQRKLEEVNHVLAAVVDSSNDAILSKDLNGSLRHSTGAPKGSLGTRLKRWLAGPLRSSFRRIGNTKSGTSSLAFGEARGLNTMRPCVVARTEQWSTFR